MNKMITTLFYKAILCLAFPLFLFGANTETLEGSKMKNNRIKMLNGKYAKLYDFNKEGPMIVNFWTTW